MNQKEHYHTAREYQTRGIDPFLKHVREYLAGSRTIPVSKTSHFCSNNDITFTLSDGMLELMVDHQKALKKPYGAAVKHGFKGYSKGGRNGIFYQRGGDNGLLKATDRFTELEKFRSQILQDLDIKEEGLDKLKKVKIVWHNPEGGRIVGLYNEKTHRIIFLDFANY